MKYRTLGHTGIKVSELCLDTVMFSGWADEQETLDRAIDAGINFVLSYNAETGRNIVGGETLIGNALKSPGKRAKVILANILRAGMFENGASRETLARNEIVSHCEDALRRLQTDYFDLYLVGWPIFAVGSEEVSRSLNRLIDQGKVRFVGVTGEVSQKSIESSVLSNHQELRRFAAIQRKYNILDRRAERDVLSMTESRSIAFISFAPCASGILDSPPNRNEIICGPSKVRGSKKWSQRELVDWFSEQFYQKHRAANAFDVYEQIKSIAEELDCSPGQVALAWCIGPPGVTSTGIAPKNPSELMGHLRTLEVTLSEEHRREIDRVAPPGKAVVP